MKAIHDFGDALCPSQSQCARTWELCDVPWSSPEVTLELEYTERDALVFAWVAKLKVISRARGQGLARERMRALCAEADRLQVVMRLAVVTDDPWVRPWYFRLGFVPISKDFTIYERYPK